MYLNCPRCRTTNEPDALFCKSCGSAFAVKPTRKNSVAVPLTIIVSILALCGFCGLFGLITGDKKPTAQSSNGSVNSSVRTLVGANSSENKAEISATPVPVPPAAGEERMGVVISENANLRKAEGVKSEIVGTLPKDTAVEVVKRSGAWFYIRAVGGQSGWLHGDTIRLNDGVQPSKPAKKATQETQTVASPKKEEPEDEDADFDEGDSDTSSGDSSRNYIIGPRGGCYYINRNGNKTYVDRSMCGGTSPTPRRSSSSSGNGGYIRGPRGGCYYINRNGNKTYVDRSLCN